MKLLPLATPFSILSSTQSFPLYYLTISLPRSPRARYGGAVSLNREVPRAVAARFPVQRNREARETEQGTRSRRTLGTATPRGEPAERAGPATPSESGVTCRADRSVPAISSREA